MWNRQPGQLESFHGWVDDFFQHNRLLVSQWHHSCYSKNQMNFFLVKQVIQNASRQHHWGGQDLPCVWTFKHRGSGDWWEPSGWTTMFWLQDELFLYLQLCRGSLPYHKQEIDTCKNSYPSIIFILQTWICNQMVMLMFVYIKTRCTALCKHREPRLISFIACV